jgi:hypothetical protein
LIGRFFVRKGTFRHIRAGISARIKGGEPMRGNASSPGSLVH